MRRFLPLSISVGLLVVSIIGGSILTSDMEVAAQTAGTPTPESEEPGYTNYSGYYRMRCWPACHSKDFPESMQSQSQSKPGYTNYSGYYRMRCWPACHSKDFPESMQSQSQSKPGYTNYSGYYRMRCWPACHSKDFPESMKGY